MIGLYYASRAYSSPVDLRALLKAALSDEGDDYRVMDHERIVAERTIARVAMMGGPVLGQCLHGESIALCDKCAP